MFSNSTECRILGAGQGTGEGENQERDKNCDNAEEESGPGGQETFQERDEDCDNAEEEMSRGLNVAMGGLALPTKDVSGGRRGTSWGETQERIHDNVEEDIGLDGDALEGERGTGWGETDEKDDDRDDVEKGKCRGLSQTVDGVARGGRLDSSITKVLSVSVPEEVAPAGKTEEDLFTPFMEFPPEIALKIFMYMDPEDILKISQTCRLLRSLSEEDKLWGVKCKEEGLIYSLNSKDEELFVRRNTDSFSRWKTNFFKHLRIKANFCQNPIRQPVVLGLEHHYDLLEHCVEFVGNKIVSLARSMNTIKIWDPLSGICLATLYGHTDTVMVIQVDDPFIISGSADNSLKVWNSETGECIRTLQGIFGHTDTVFCLHLYGGILVSGSRDGTVRLWNIQERSSPKVFVGHLEAVTCVQFNGKLVASGSRHDRTVKIWDSETAEYLHTFVHTSGITKVKFSGVHVVSSSWDEIIRVWDMETGTCMYRLEPIKPMVVSNKGNVMKLHGNLLVSGHLDSTVKIWNTLTWNCLKTLDCASSPGEAVTALDFNDNFVVTGSRDGKVKLWDIKTGQFERLLLVLEGSEVRMIMMKEAMVVVCANRDMDNKGYVARLAPHKMAAIHVLNFDIH